MKPVAWIRVRELAYMKAMLPLPDAAGKRAASKAVKTLAGYGIECRVIQSTKDPKLLHRATIKELIA